ncbi:hypothetical protein NP493_28g03054 [Ridgeia piscesae]|uniref:Uncharacterized protein n=1 Tax=Ridgeia piscesae TaxID=27915 RepID=A0AAD9UKE6_RIDPI|nr:hypothetical protein NP493_28g03054 [Ridgeia piscesae]
MSMSLQGMVDELIRKKTGERIKRPQDRRRISNGRCPSHARKESSSHSIKSPTASTPETEVGSSFGKETTIKSISDKISAVTLKGPTPNHMEDASGLTTENDAFEGIGDDDL